MEILGWCKWCGSPITKENFIGRVHEFDPFVNELEVAEWYQCSCGVDVSNRIVYKLVEKENRWEELSKADPNYGIWEEDKEE